MIIFGNFRHARIIAHRAGSGFDPEINYCISRANEAGELLGGVVYTNYTGRSVMGHIAGFAPYWLTPELLYAIFDFPFNFLKVERIFVTVPTPNERSFNLAQKMGFEWVTAIPAVVSGGDLDVLSMSRRDCRWLKLKARFSAGLMENAA